MKRRPLISLLVALAMMLQLSSFESEESVLVVSQTENVAGFVSQDHDHRSIVTSADLMDVMPAPMPVMAETLPTLPRPPARGSVRALQPVDQQAEADRAPPHLASRQHSLWLRISTLRI